MNDAQKKAWDCLNEIERQSLWNPFIFLEKTDYVLYNFIRKILPYNWESYSLLRKDINKILDSY